MKISIIIPVFNEEKTIEEILKRVISAPVFDCQKEIIVINDGSTDKTREILQNLSPKITLINLEENHGKGFALREGFKKASGEIIVIQDADLEYNPKDYEKLLAPILEGKTKIVYGSRNLNPEIKPFSKIYLWGGKLVTGIFNLLFKTKLTDVFTGYKIFKKEVLKELCLKENRFGFDVEFSSKAIKKGFTVLEVPISYTGRSFKEGKRIRWIDGIKGLFIIFMVRITKEKN